MKKIITAFWAMGLCLSALGQGTTIRSLNGIGTNTTLNGILLPAVTGASMAWTNNNNLGGNAGWYSPQDAGSGFMSGNTGHGTSHGNGIEWENLGNQFEWQVTDGNHYQFGAAGIHSIGEAMYMNYNDAGVLANYSFSDFFEWNTGPLGYWASWAEMWNFTNVANGGTMLHFVLPDPTDNADFTQLAGRKALFTLDSDNGIELNGYTRIGYSVQSSSTTNCAINLTNSQFQEFDLTQAAFFYMTNLNLQTHFTNTVALNPTLLIYSGPGGAQFTTFPTNWIWFSESGLAVAPTNVPAATVMRVDLTITVGSATNILAHYTLGPYSPSYDATALAFFTATGIVDGPTRGALNTLVVNGKAHGWFSQLDAFYPFTGPNGVATSTTATWNIIATNKFPIAWTSAGTATFNATGVAGDGSAAFGDTQMNPNTASSPKYTLASAMYGVYSRYNYGFTGGGQDDMGSAATGLSLLFSSAGSAGAATFLTIRGPNSAASGTITAGTGFQISVQNSGTAFNFSGVNSNSGANTPTSVPQADFYVLAEDNGGLNRPSTNSIACAFIGAGLTGGTFTSFTNDVAVFLQSEGRY